jgi:hypothetical protein
MEGHPVSKLQEYCGTIILVLAIIVIVWFCTKENAWFKKKPERMAVGNVFRGYTYGIQGRQRGDFFVPVPGMTPANTPAIVGWVVPQHA